MLRAAFATASVAKKSLPVSLPAYAVAANIYSLKPRAIVFAESESGRDMCGLHRSPEPPRRLAAPGIPGRKRDGDRQSHSYAMVIFNEPGRWLVLISAGCVRGYGLYRLMDKVDFSQ